MFRPLARYSTALVLFLLATGTFGKAEWRFADGVTVCNGSNEKLFARMSQKPQGPVGWTRQTRAGRLSEVTEFEREAPFDGDAPDGSVVELDPGESVRILGDDIMKWSTGANFVVRTADGQLVDQILFSFHRTFGPNHWEFRLWDTGHYGYGWTVARRRDTKDPLILHREGTVPVLKPESKESVPDAELAGEGAGIGLQAALHEARPAPAAQDRLGQEVKAGAPVPAPAPPRAAAARLGGPIAAPARPEPKNEPQGARVPAGAGAGLQPAAGQPRVGQALTAKQRKKKKARERKKLKKQSTSQQTQHPR